MKREREREFIVGISILVCILVAVIGWLLGYNYGTKQATEQATGGSQEITTNQVTPEESNEQTDSEKGKAANRTIWEVANSQASYDKYTLVASFHEGLAYASKESERSILGIYGYIDENGNEAIDFQYKIAHNFSGGLAAVSEDAKKFGYIDHQGNWVIEPILDAAGEFRDGRARVQIGIKWYIIDKEGNILEEVKSD